MVDNLLTITQDDLKTALNHKRPVIVYFYDSDEKTDKPLESALKSVAKKNTDDLVVARVDVTENRRLFKQYGPLATPALVTLVKGFLGHKVKSEAEAVRPKDVRAHVDYLLERGPEPADDNGVAERPTATPSKKSATKQVTDRTFKKDVLKAKTPVLVDFWAPWCAPCQALAPFMEEIAGEYKGRVRIAKLNVDQNPATKDNYQIMSIPTLMMFKDGEPIERRTGANAATIRAMIDEALLT
jgi:thioredoxin 1